ncbi:hypothetical protein NW759_001702 [Fusarium solani]|nr:hypothetical protein NW759_001702 [Fusarium solani]
MSIPMQVSIPLALHLRSPVRFNLLTNEHWNHGEKYQEGRSLQEFAFMDSHSGRYESTLLFASILRSIFNHPDWSQLHAFFTKRYSKSEMSSHPNREACKLTPTGGTARFTSNNWAIVHFKTDPSSVGLPQDLTVKLANAGRTARGRLVGPDPQPCAIGPAISVAMGAAAYMDLAYGGHPPGEYPERHGIGPLVYGREGIGLQPVPKGGRGRTWADWAELWSIIAEWVYEYDATSLELGLYRESYSYRRSDKGRRKIPVGAKMPREYLGTDSIDAADAIHAVFSQLAAKPMDFQGIEWDFLELEVEREVREAFFARFGKKPDPSRRLEELVKPVVSNNWNALTYNDVSPVALKPCPESFRGADWETWLLSVEGGDVVVVKTLFQALWAVMLLVQLPLNVKIIDKEDRFPRYRDPDDVYL